MHSHASAEPHPYQDEENDSIGSSIRGLEVDDAVSLQKDRRHYQMDVLITSGGL